MYYPTFGKLLEGRAKSEEIELVWQHVSPPDKIFRQVIETAPYDLAEMSLSTYTMLRDKGWDGYIGLPIFPSKRFRHSAFFVRTESDIVGAEQLAGKRVGLPEYGLTAAVWLRGILEDDFGVRPEQIQWFTGGAEQPGRVERVPLAAEIAARVQTIEPDETLFGMLLDRRLDAVICVYTPQLLRGNKPPIRHLFVNYKEVEKEYYSRRGIFPIMHTLVLRRGIAADDKDVAGRISRLLQNLRDDFYSKLAIVRRNSVFPWIEEYIDELTETFGEDPWAHGIGKNGRALGKFLDYSHSQGLIERKPQVKELFIDLDE
jgi:4,5-dihydroxyphthalate decarboxylase